MTRDTLYDAAILAAGLLIAASLLAAMVANT